VVSECFHPETRLLLVTQCCHGSGAVVDLSRRELAGRPICCISAVQGQGQRASGGGSASSGSAFALAMLETVQRCVREGETEFSVVHVFNECQAKSENWQEDWQELRFERTEGFDPDTFTWPLMPPRGWQVLKDKDFGIAPREAWQSPFGGSSFDPWSAVPAASSGPVPLAFRRGLNGGA